MIELLQEAVKELPYLLYQEGWKSLFVDYHKPYVFRLYRQWRDIYRLSLHQILPVDDASECLFHPHPWPSAIMIVSGQYEQAIGYRSAKDACFENSHPSKIVRSILRPGSMYEMLTPDEWHYVRPIGLPSYSIMLSGPPFSKPDKKENQPVSRPLEKDEIQMMFDFFRDEFQMADYLDYASHF